MLEPMRRTLIASSAPLLCLPLLAFAANCGSNSAKGSQDASADEDAGTIVLGNGDGGHESGHDGALDGPALEASFDSSSAKDVASETACGECGDASACCATGCADLQNDARNCGACGHDCALGMCSAGACRAYALVSAPNIQENTFIAFDGVNVAFGDQGTATVAQIPVVGGSIIKLASVGSYGVGIGGGKVFYVANGSPLSFDVATEGAPNSDMVLHASLSNGWVSQVAATPDGQTQFFVQQHVPGFAFYVSTAANLQSPLSGAGPSFPTQIVADTDHAFFSEPSAGKVWAYSVATQQTSAIVTGQSNPDFVALDGAYLYWANDTPAIERIPIGGGSSQTVLAPLPAAATGLATDGKYVYFAAGATVYYTPAGGGGSANTLSAQTAATDGPVLSGGGYVVWLDSGHQTIDAIRTPL